MVYIPDCSGALNISEKNIEYICIYIMELEKNYKKCKRCFVENGNKRYNKRKNFWFLMFFAIMCSLASILIMLPWTAKEADSLLSF